MKKYASIAVLAIFFIVGLFLYLFQPQESVPIASVPTVQESSNTPIITEQPSDTPVINLPEIVVKPDTWFADQETILNSLSARIASERHIANADVNPANTNLNLAKLNEVRIRCLEILQEYNTNIGDTNRTEIPASKCE